MVQKQENKQENKEPKSVNNAAAAEAATTQPADNQKSETTLFTTKSEKKIINTPKVNILGKIDLSTLNQSTRPKKKSKEEKRKERENKAQQQRGGNGADNKKKRERINKVRVDINAASNQPGANQGGKNTNAGGNGGGSGKNKKKNRNRGQQKPAEVSEEDVARQVKETLARLTNKQSQNKKGAKYRKEKREAAQEKMNEERREEKKESKTLKLTEFVTVSELATMMNVSVNQVIGTLMSVGIMVSINQRLDAETINLVAEEFGFKTEYVSAEVQEAITEVEVRHHSSTISARPTSSPVRRAASHSTSVPTTYSWRTDARLRSLILRVMRRSPPCVPAVLRLRISPSSSSQPMTL